MKSATTINEIVNQVYNDKRFNNAIKNILKNSKLLDDAKQEIYMALLTHEPQKLLEVYNDGIAINETNERFLQYYVRICLNQFCSSSSSFYRTFKRNISDDLSTLAMDTMNDIKGSKDNLNSFKNLTTEDNTINKLLSKQIDDYVYKNISWDDRIIFDMYFKGDMTYRGIANLTKIPHSAIFNSIHKTLNKVKKHIRLK